MLWEAEKVAETDLKHVVHLSGSQQLRADAHEQADPADEQASRFELAVEASGVALEVDEGVEIQLQPRVSGAEHDVADARAQLVNVRARAVAADRHLFLREDVG